MLRSRAHRHDMPERYGNWKSAHKRFTRWAYKGLMDDKGYDSNAIRSQAKAQKILTVIPGRSHRKKNIRYNKSCYKDRNRIGRCFGKLKNHRRLATRYDRNDVCSLSFIFLAASLLWISLNVNFP